LPEPNGVGLSVDSEVRRALAIASPSFQASLDRVRANDPKAPELLIKLRRFVTCMSTRPTPFGTFAGVRLAHWGPKTNLFLGSGPRTRTRVDMGWLVQYVMGLEPQPAIRDQLLWQACLAVQIRHGWAYLAEPEAPRGSPGTVTVEATEAVTRVLALTRAALPYPELVSRLGTEFPDGRPHKSPPAESRANFGSLGAAARSSEGPGTFGQTARSDDRDRYRISSSRRRDINL
jgi:hypothetical protein